MPQTSTQTRYHRVLAILDQAAGESPADYGGLGRFWHRSVKDLKTMKLGGLPLIADAALDSSGSCCCAATAQDPGATMEEALHCPGRGAASGLIIGLRGQFPFDGSRFPPLPWGGSRVAPADIDYISAWIDDGCLTTKSELVDAGVDASLAEGSTLEAFPADRVEVVANETFSVYNGPTNAYKYQKGELKQRMNIDCLTLDQREALRAAFRELYRLNKWPEDSRNYNNLALIHQNHCQHGWERFLPWHRVYLYEFEQALQDIDPSVTMPYWDWTMPQYRPARPETGWILPKTLQAYLTDASIEYLKNATPALPAGQAKKLSQITWPHRFPTLRRFFTAAIAAGLDKKYTVGAHRNRFIDALLAANALWYPLRYSGEYQTPDGTPSTINRVIQYHYPTAEDIEQIMSLRTFRDFGGGSLYNDAFGFMDQNPHNTLHIWTGGMNPDYGKSPADFGLNLAFDRNRGVRVSGRQFHSREDMYSQPQYGDMFSNLTAAYDPVFWPVHSNVDRLWNEWQQHNPHAIPSDLDAILTPWSYTIADTLDMYRFGYEYVKMTYLIPVGLEAPVGRFVSKPIDVPEQVGASFQKAEVRLHRVPQLPRSCFIRVFLNLPDANANTPLDDPHYAGYLAIFGHGPCYGGPGHCDLPPPRAREFDRRPRHHNTPRNHRINVTKCAQRLLGGDEPASSLQITLVVIGADYAEDRELLRLDGVSLNLLD